MFNSWGNVTELSGVPPLAYMSLLAYAYFHYISVLSQVQGLKLRQTSLRPCHHSKHNEW